MKYLLLILIKIYQAFIPKSLRGKCLFKESCSNYVYRVTKEKGFEIGLKAFIYRFRNCRSNYHIIIDNEKVFLITVEKEVLEKNLIDERILSKNGCTSIKKWHDVLEI